VTPFCEPWSCYATKAGVHGPTPGHLRQPGELARAFLLPVQTRASFLYVFACGPPGRTRRQHGGLARPSAGAPRRTGPTPVGWRGNTISWAAIGIPQSSGSSVRAVSCSRCGIVQDRAEPVKAVCGRRTTAPVKLPGERTREDDLDGTLPGQGNGSNREQGHKWTGTADI
jgi:hypothetical protein